MLHNGTARQRWGSSPWPDIISQRGRPHHRVLSVMRAMTRRPTMAQCVSAVRALRAGPPSC